MTVFKAAFESKKLECTRGWGIVWWKYLLLINESTPKAKVRYPNDGFLCSVLLRMSSEWCLALRIHNTDQQCYEFWVLEVIPSSFRVAQNERKSVIGIPNQHMQIMIYHKTSNSFGSSVKTYSDLLLKAIFVPLLFRW